MATANKNNIVKRIDVSRKLTYQEMDTNFEMLKLTIDDTAALEGQLANKVDTAVYNTKMGEIDTSITALETSGVTEGRVDNIDARVTTNETDITNLDTRVSTAETNISSNDTDITNLDTRVSTAETNIDEALVPTWNTISTSQTLTVNTRYLVDFTTGPLSLTLPATPVADDFVKISGNGGDSTGSIITRNGSTIMGLAENTTIDYNITSIKLVYNGTDWRII